MSIKSYFAKLMAQRSRKRIESWSSNPILTQQRVFNKLVESGKRTKFGIDHAFGEISKISDFQANVPVRDYESLRVYIEQVVAGEPDVLWPGKPLYFAKTSGTTSGSKFIPITKESMPEHINAAKSALLMFIADTGQSSFVDGKMIFLQGSPVLKEVNGIKQGRLSGIVAHYIPKYLQKNRLPSWETNCIEDWETKVDTIVKETIDQDMRVISGIPSWVQMYFEKLVEQSGKSIGDLFPNFNLFVFGGVNFAPYKSKFEQLIGRKVPSVELFPASEGFFAFQDRQDREGLLLLLDSGIFYEFVEASAFFDDHYARLTLEEVRMNVNYVMIISTTAGLWAYNLGDTISFTSLLPFRIKVTGRIKHFISAFGEHVIGQEVERAMQVAIEGTNAVVNEFSVAPQVNPSEGLPFHEWFVDFDTEPSDMNQFRTLIDSELQKLNTYYKDLIIGKVLQPLKVSSLKKGSFDLYMGSLGKLGGQNKLPRLANNRDIATFLETHDFVLRR